jgi:lysophospholipase L1-like esterase
VTKTGKNTRRLSSADRRKNQTTTRRRVFLLLGGTIFGLLIASVVGELAIRYSLAREFEAKVHQFNESDGFHYEIVPSERVGYRLKPDQQIEAKPGIVYTINPDGFRQGNDDVWDDGNTRILFVGDSFTFGWGVNDKETFPAVAERLLREQMVQVDCLNLGVIGYNLTQYKSIVAEGLKRFDPKLVVVTVYVNDAEPTNLGLVPRPPTESFQDVCFWSWHELAFQWDWPNRKRVETDALISFRTDNPKRRDARTAFSDIALSCKESDVQLLIVSAPLVLNSDFQGRYKYVPVQTIFQHWADDAGVTCIDLREAILASDHPPEDFVIPNDGHFSVDGNKFVAGLIADWALSVLKISK